MPIAHLSGNYRCHLRTLRPTGNSDALRGRMVSLPGAMLLESLGPISSTARWSLFAVDPCRSLTVDAAGGMDPFERLSEAWRPWRMKAVRASVMDPSVMPFTAGWIGYLSYEAGRYVEPTAMNGAADHELPVAHFSLYDTVLIHDRRSEEWRLVASDLPVELTHASRLSAVDRLAHWSDWLTDSARKTPPVGYAARDEAEAGGGLWNDTPMDYLDKVRRVLHYIASGDVFQANLARRYRASYSGTIPALYQRLCRHNPAAYSACIPLDERRAVLSSSPELFLVLTADGEIETRPIKGTRPRMGREPMDSAAQRELSSHPKDRAELSMIVDLLRNDLGRVCRYGSVEVVCDGEIEALPTVFHRTATIRGRLREECDAIDLLRATFPGGSVTGAPKVRAMQIIRELEGFPRGPYCGAIGWIGLDGSMSLNLAIRTLALHEGVVDLCVGSGIVADSDPLTEYEELAAKAAGMMAALGGHCGLSETGRSSRHKRHGEEAKIG